MFKKNYTLFFSLINCFFLIACQSNWNYSDLVRDRARDYLNRSKANNLLIPNSLNQDALSRVYSIPKVADRPILKNIAPPGSLALKQNLATHQLK